MQRFRLSERARKFLREVGSIVLGVLIALAIGEVADTLRHRHNAGKLMVAVRAEMGVTGIVLEERMMIGRCIIRRLDRIKALLAAARATGTLQRIDTIGTPNIRPIVNVAWTTLVGNGELLHLDPDDAELAKRYYKSVDKYEEYQLQEQVGWARLNVLQKRVGPVGEDLMADLETTIEEARANALIVNIMARQMWQKQHLLNVATDYDYYDDMSREQMVTKARTSPVCGRL